MAGPQENQIHKKTVKKILIIQTAFLGDVVLTTPLIREVKRVFPDVWLDVLVIPQTKGILQNNPHIHSLITFDKRGARIRGFIKTIFELRRQKYDACLLPHRSATSARLATYAKIPQRIGYDGRRPARFYTERILFDRGKNQINRYLDLLRFFRDGDYDSQTELFFSQQIIQSARTPLNSLKDLPVKIAIAPGSVWPTKRWPEDYFGELTRKLASHNIGLILIGSPAEKPLCDRIQQHLKYPYLLNLAGQTGILEAAAIVRECDLLICNDSGTMHMANAVHTDVFAFFGPTVERFGFAPFRSPDTIFQVELDCRPCASHGGKKCPLGHFQCMLRIEPEWVYKQICKKFAL